MSEFGDLLRYYRQKVRDPKTGKAPSQEKMAELLGVSDSSYGHYERGIRKIGADEREFLVKLVHVLHQIGGIETLDEANRLLRQGNYSNLESDEIRSINSHWLQEQTTPAARNETKVLGVFTGAPPPPSSFVGPEGDLAGLAKTRGPDSIEPTILVIDDDLTTESELFKHLLRSFAGHKLLLLNDPQEACTLLAHHHHIVGCITDIVFRKYSEVAGVHVAEVARRNKVPVVIFTGHRRQNVGLALAELKRVGISKEKVLTKPVTREQYQEFLVQVKVGILENYS